MLHKVDLADIPKESPVRGMADYYAQLKQGAAGQLPFWRDFNPVEAPAVLPWLIVMTCQEGDGSDLKIKLAGERVIETIGVNLAGRTLVEAFGPQEATSRLDEARLVFESGEPAFTRCPLPHPDRSFIEVYRGCFAFREEGGDACRFVVVFSPVNESLI